jgi:hypothetical protein
MAKDKELQAWKLIEVQGDPAEQSWAALRNMVEGWTYPKHAESLFCSKSPDGTILSAGVPLREVLSLGMDQPLTDEQWQSFLDKNDLDEEPPEGT